MGYSHWSMDGVLSALILAAGLIAGYFLGRKSAPKAEIGDPELPKRLIQLEKELTRHETEKRVLEERMLTHQEESAELQRQSQTQFENLANKILEKNSEKFRESGERSLKELLNPLREKIQTFEKKVEDTYDKEMRERLGLKLEIKQLLDLNQQMSQEANNLTRALKSDVKVQGNWGELILERLLTQSGLREGHEYILQGADLKLKSVDGDHLKPDVVVNLPGGNHLIIDSKVSLKSYESYCNGESDEVRTKQLKLFLDSVYKHVDGLSSKHYASLEGLRSPDYVLLFVPLEPAFALALQSDAQLISYAWGKKIAFVSPTTLLATLGTVASLWKTERQNKNALEIARQGGALYDKFVAFVGDLERVGKSIDDSSRAYHEAFNKIKDGRGSLVSRVENLRKLGVKATKTIDDKHLPEEQMDLIEGPASLEQNGDRHPTG